MKVVISSGHGLHVRGASGYIDEVNEARRVVPEVAKQLESLGVGAITFNDDTSTTQNQNLETIVNFHNSQVRNLDVSVHFNAYTTTSSPMGTECLYLTQDTLATQVASAVSEASGLIDRGPKERTNLYFLNKTDMPAILIEVCFVDSQTDVDIYESSFEAICQAIAEAISGRVLEEPEFYEHEGLVSWFGGPEDSGVAPDEGLAFIYEIDDAPQLFLPKQPPGTTGLARRLDPEEYYIAMRWDYEKTPPEVLLNNVALVKAKKTGKQFYAYPADWGPHISTGRIADISPGLMEALGIQTDDVVEVSFPHNMQLAKEI